MLRKSQPLLGCISEDYVFCFMREVSVRLEAMNEARHVG